MPSLRVSFGDHRGTPSLQLVGELDADARALVDEAIAGIEKEYPQLVIDLSGLDFMDSTGLHVILAAHERAARDGRKISVIKGSPHVQKVFEVTGLDLQLDFLEPGPLP